MMGNKFSTKFDYFQAIFGIASFIILLSINTNFGTILLGLFILVFGVYKAFGRRILFNDENVIVIHLISKIKINYSEVKEVRYVTQLYGKSILRVFTSQKQFNGYIDYSNWKKLKSWLEEKEINCNESR